MMKCYHCGREQVAEIHKSEAGDWTTTISWCANCGSVNKKTTEFIGMTRPEEVVEDDWQTPYQTRKVMA